MRLGWQVGSFSFLLLFVCAIWLSARLPLQDELGPGPGFFPLWLAMIGGVLSAVLLVQTVRKPVPGHEDEALMPDRPALQRILAVLILLAVGSLIATWILAGIVPTLIYYGLAILHPAIFYPAACLICALVGLSIGSSWTVAGTLGIALIGVASAMGLSPAVTAGAIISGAYFGDKMSPLSDTTNLAPAVAGSELFAHVRHMTWTTVPSLLLAISGFLVIGLVQPAETGAAGFNDMSAVLARNFDLGWYLLLPLAVVMAMAWRKMPAFPTMMIGALLGGVFGQHSRTVTWRTPAMPRSIRC